MNCNRLLVGLVALSAVFGMAGCGGSGSTSPTFPTGAVNFSGAPTTEGASTTTTTVPASGGATVTISGGTTAVVPSGSVPPGTVLPAGTEFAIIPAGVGFPGSVPGGSQLSVNNTEDSGALVGTNGLLSVNVALPVTPGPDGTNYSLTFPTATISTDRSLTIHNTVFVGKFYLLISGGTFTVVSPVPTNLSGVIPNNGQNAAGSHVLSTFGGGNNGRSTNLLVDYGTGFQLHQTKTIATSQASFANLVFDSEAVPRSGVQLLQFVVGDL